MKHRADERRGWTIWHLIAAMGLVLLGIYFTSNAWLDMFHIALSDEESSHVLLVPIAVAWLVWVRKGRFRQCRPARSLIGTALIGIGWLLWDVGYRHPQRIQSFFHLGAILVAVGCLLTVVGKDVLFRFLPAFVALGFLIPVPARVRTPIAIRMQMATAEATQTTLQMLGVDVARYGNTLRINGQDVAVEEACNGMRMVFTLMMVCYIFAFITPLKDYVRILIVLASPLTALVCNVIRLVPTVYLYGQLGQPMWTLGTVTKHGLEQFHDWGGWVMLVVAFGLLTSIVRVLRWAMIPVTTYTLASA
jgi:exosortase